MPNNLREHWVDFTIEVQMDGGIESTALYYPSEANFDPQLRYLLDEVRMAIEDCHKYINEKCVEYRIDYRL